MRSQNWIIHIEFFVLVVTIICGLYLLQDKIDRQGKRIDSLFDIFKKVQEEIKESKIINCVKTVEKEETVAGGE
mgnify:CR=1 FL=1